MSPKSKEPAATGVVAVDVPGKTHVIIGVLRWSRRGRLATVETWHEHPAPGCLSERTRFIDDVLSVRVLRASPGGGVSFT